MLPQFVEPRVLIGPRLPASCISLPQGSADSRFDSLPLKTFGRHPASATSFACGSFVKRISTDYKSFAISDSILDARELDDSALETA